MVKRKLEGKDKEILGYYNDGFSDQRIADKFDVSGSTIKDFRRRNLLIANHKSWNRITKKQIPLSVKRNKMLRKIYNKREYVVEKHKEYAKRPEVKEKIKQYKKEYAKRPEVKEKIKQYQKKHYQRPDIKARIKKLRKKRYLKSKLK